MCKMLHVVPGTWWTFAVTLGSRRDNKANYATLKRDAQFALHNAFWHFCDSENIIVTITILIIDRGLEKVNDLTQADIK